MVDPVRVQHAQVGTAAADTFFGGGFEGALIFQLIDTLVGRFALKVAEVSGTITTKYCPTNHKLRPWALVASSLLYAHECGR